jgi:hypothetical protein
VAEYILVFGRLRGIIYFFPDLTSYFIEKAGGMPFGLVFFGQSIAFTFGSNAMKYFRAWNFFQIFQYAYQVVDIMPIYRTKIPEFERFKQIALL